jgi:hypothetical protein
MKREERRERGEEQGREREREREWGGGRFALLCFSLSSLALYCYAFSTIDRRPTL